MAERLASAYGVSLGIRDLRTGSAGTRAVVDHPIHNEAAVVIRCLGGDASNFEARRLTPRIASDADLILTMTAAHRDIVLELAPQLFGRTFTLAEAALIASRPDAQSIGDLRKLRPHLQKQRLRDVPDPIGQSSEIFSSVGAQIAEYLLPILELCRDRS